MKKISKCLCFALWVMMAVKDSKYDMHNKSGTPFMKVPWNGFKHLCLTMKLSGSSQIRGTPFWVRYSITYSIEEFEMKKKKKNYIYRGTDPEPLV